VSQLWSRQPDIATCGTCCLVGVIQKNTLHIANAGDSRVVLGKKVGHKVEAVQLSTEHNANLEEVRREMKARHPDDSQIVEFKHGGWRVKGIIQVYYLYPI
jgi:pyruvate dehydrogenase phosphatase